MPDKKISQLPAITTPTNADLLAIVQAGITSNVTFANLINGLGSIYWALNGNTLGSEKFIGTLVAFSLPFRINNVEVGRFLYSATASINGNLGINIQNPSAKLHIKGYDATSSNHGLKISDSTSVLNFYVANDGVVNSRLGFWLLDDKFIYRNTNGSSLAIGLTAGNSLPDDNNICIGKGSGFLLAAGAADHILIGVSAGASIIGGATRNVYVGTGAGASSTTSGSNVYIGWHAGNLTTIGAGSDVAIGYAALAGQTTGDSNTAIGYFAGLTLTTGIRNVFIGREANVAVGTESFSIAIGRGALVTANNQLVIGSTSAEIDNAYIGKGATAANADANLFVGSLNLNPSIDTTAGDSATINKTAGRFRKDTSGTTFVLTNSYITANSIIQLTYASDPGVTGNTCFVVAGAGSATITFTTAGVAGAPANNTDINFLVIN